MKDLFWKTFYKNGNIKQKGWYSFEKKQDYWYFYYENGSLKKEGHFKNNLMEDWWIYYTKSGSIDYKVQLKKNIKHGISFLYTKNQIVKALRYDLGIKVNEWNDYKTFKKDNKLFIFTNK